MKTLKAVVAKYNQTSLILRILIGLAGWRSHIFRGLNDQSCRFLIRMHCK